MFYLLSIVTIIGYNNLHTNDYIRLLIILIIIISFITIQVDANQILNLIINFNEYKKKIYKKHKDT